MEKSLFSKEYDLLLQQLRVSREEAGLTQAQLAERLATTQSWVSKCERGERRLDMVEVRTWCRALGISFPDFAARFDSILSQRRNKQ